jgi:hypothetical protein
MTDKTKFDAVELATVLKRLTLSAEARAAIAGLSSAGAAVEQLAAAGYVAEATQLAAHALPRREAVWWACQCAAHTAPADLPSPDRAAREEAEAWVRRPSDAARRQAMARAQESGFATPEAWAAVAAFWSEGSMAPPDQPAVPAALHLTGTAVCGAVMLAAVRDRPERRLERLARFLDSARDIARGGAGRLASEVG